MEDREKKSLLGVAILGIGVLAVLALIFIGYPIYNVWASEKDGQANYMKATQDRNIRILEATANREAALHNYNTTIINARAHADSIAIIGKELEMNPDYLTYMWIQDTGDAGDMTYIYVPSGEFGMPIQEAVRTTRPIIAKE